MFTQRISMGCTKEQYEKYLKEELLKMGHEEYSVNCWNDTKFHYICNNYGGYLGGLGTIPKDDVNDYDRTYLISFNAPLFLALAAMTDKAEGNYGEYFIGLGSGRLYKMREEDKTLPKYNMFRKATKEEIMAKFSEKKCNHNTLENKIDQLNEKGKIEVNISFDATELESEIINWFKNDTQDLSESPIYFHRNQSGSNDGLRVQNIDLAIKILKSNGYKILKKKETWEEV